MLRSKVSQTGEAMDRTRNPWFTWRVVYQIHHCGSRDLELDFRDYSERETFEIISNLKITRRAGLSYKHIY